MRMTLQSANVNQTPIQENANLEPYRVQDPEKLRGGYYTSLELARWLCEWAIRNSTDSVLEPSCGDGVFLSAATNRFAALGETSRSSIADRLLGIELNPQEAQKAKDRLQESLGESARQSVHTGDFFQWRQIERGHKFNAVVGNPPFIRYHSFPEPFRERALSIMSEVGLKPNRLTNIWVPFVVAATTTLLPGGRLALVLPAELLQVSYASQLRSFLVDRFAKIDIITCNELFFKNAEQEVVLLLADGARTNASSERPCRVTMTEFDTVGEVTKHPPDTVLAKTQPKTVHHSSEKWLKYLLTQNEINLMRELRQAPEITELRSHASVDVGVVTGRNGFFVLGEERLSEMGISEYTIPIISRAKQLQGAWIGEDEWADLADSGDRVHLLHLEPHNGTPLNESLERYIRFGESEGVNTGYKCSIRSPWYAIPSVWEPHGFMLRQIYDFPRIVLNRAGATCTDTIHRLKCKDDPPQLITNTYTYLTGASAEIEGRSYGGGMLALEPTEAERLLVPSQLVQAINIEVCDEMVRSGQLERLLQENSERILVDDIGLSRRDCEMLRDIWKKMSTRRRMRGRRNRSKPG